VPRWRLGYEATGPGGSGELAGPDAGELAERLAGYCREHLAGFKWPRSFEFTTGELRTPAGKIRRGQLREQFGALAGPYSPRR
jgi:acyl-CoA synthetase (AMP-forming)/AMP-acid ligase II